MELHPQVVYLEHNHGSWVFLPWWFPVTGIYQPWRESRHPIIMTRVYSHSCGLKIEGEMYTKPPQVVKKCVSSSWSISLRSEENLGWSQCVGHRKRLQCANIGGTVLEQGAPKIHWWRCMIYLLYWEYTPFSGRHIQTLKTHVVFEATEWQRQHDKQRC